MFLVSYFKFIFIRSYKTDWRKKKNSQTFTKCWKKLSYSSLQNHRVPWIIQSTYKVAGLYTDNPQIYKCSKPSPFVSPQLDVHSLKGPNHLAGFLLKMWIGVRWVISKVSQLSPAKDKMYPSSLYKMSFKSTNNRLEWSILNMNINTVLS